MGVIKKLLKTGLWTGLGSAAGVGGTMAYILSSSQIVDLPRDDPMFRDRTYGWYNPRGTPALSDVVIKRVPLSKIKPELRNSEEALTLEFCRGVWSRWGFWPQSKYQQKYDRPAKTEDNLWDIKDLATAKFDRGLRIVNHFEVVNKKRNEIWIRCGGSPMDSGLRKSDGLIVLGARIDKAAQEVEFTFKSSLFNSSAPKPPRNTEIKHSIPDKVVMLHQWYVKILTQAAMGRVMA